MKENNLFENSFIVRRAITGMQGSGKTPFLTKHILPFIPPDKYFVFIPHFADEKYYKRIPKTSRILLPGTDGVSNLQTRQMDFMESVISISNTGIIFVFEDFGSDQKKMQWLRKMVELYSIQFIIVSQNINHMNKDLDDIIDIYYRIGRATEPPTKAIKASKKMYYPPFKAKSKSNTKSIRALTYL